MKTYAIIKNDIVVNVIVLEDGADPARFTAETHVAIDVTGQHVSQGMIHDNGVFSEPAPITETRWRVPKRLIVDRLATAGKLAASRATLDAADLLTRERWNTTDYVWSDAPEALALLAAIGADPNEILARP